MMPRSVSSSRPHRRSGRARCGSGTASGGLPRFVRRRRPASAIATISCKIGSALFGVLGPPHRPEAAGQGVGHSWQGPRSVVPTPRPRRLSERFGRVSPVSCAGRKRCGSEAGPEGVIGVTERGPAHPPAAEERLVGGPGAPSGAARRVRERRGPGAARCRAHLQAGGLDQRSPLARPHRLLGRALSARASASNERPVASAPWPSRAHATPSNRGEPPPRTRATGTPRHRPACVRSRMPLVRAARRPFQPARTALPTAVQRSVGPAPRGAPRAARVGRVERVRDRGGGACLRRPVTARVERLADEIMREPISVHAPPTACRRGPARPLPRAPECVIASEVADPAQYLQAELGPE